MSNPDLDWAGETRKGALPSSQVSLNQPEARNSSAFRSESSELRAAPAARALLQLGAPQGEGRTCLTAALTVACLLGRFVVLSGGYTCADIVGMAKTCMAPQLHGKNSSFSLKYIYHHARGFSRAVSHEIEYADLAVEGLPPFEPKYMPTLGDQLGFRDL